MDHWSSNQSVKKYNLTAWEPYWNMIKDVKLLIAKKKCIEGKKLHKQLRDNEKF